MGPRRALSGQPVGPVLTATAAALRQGVVGEGHVRVIRDFFRQLPAGVDVGTGTGPRLIWRSWLPSFVLISWPGWRGG